jgi:DNA repair protein RadC
MSSCRRCWRWQGATWPPPSPDDTRRFLSAQLRHHPYEVFACLFLDNRNRVIAFEELFRGTINGASVHPREVMRRTLEHNAAALILAHNHPSGVAEPSHSDRQLTERLKQALELVDVRVLDHIVVGDGQQVSFAERGWL